MKKRILIVLFITMVLLFSNSIFSWAQLNVVIGKEIRLTADLAVDVHPKWSPDRTKIAFRSERSGNGDIWVMNADGTNPVQLTIDPAEDGWPEWSPDGNRIVFRSSRSGNSDIWVMNADGTNQTQLTTDPGWEGHPDWSPDGNKIAFSSYGDIWVMNIDGSSQMQLTTNSANDAHPNYSPDGTKIAFQSNRAGDQDIWVMNSDGTNPIQLISGSAKEQHLGWSPDGTRIAYDSNISGNWDIWVMNADGSSKTQLTTDLANDNNPDWSSDGFQIVFDSNRSGNRDVWTMTFLINTPGRIVGWGGYYNTSIVLPPLPPLPYDGIIPSPPPLPYNNTSFFNFNILSNGLYPVGTFYYSDRLPMRFWSNQITGLMISPDKKKAVFRGNVKIGGVAGYRFEVYVDDNGNPGINDKFKINIYNPSNTLIYTSEGTLFTGNIQIYP